MYTAKSGKSFANPQVGAFHDKMAGGEKPGTKPSGKSEHGEANEPHSSETHGTQPHPKTGVHSVHVMHMGGGRAKTLTHHDGGHIESKEHGSMHEAQQHSQHQLPAEEEMSENESNMSPNMSDGNMEEDSLGPMMGSGE